MAYGILGNLMGNKSTDPADAWRHRAVNQGLTQMGARMMQASGPSYMPQSTIANLGKGFEAFGQVGDKERAAGLKENELASMEKTRVLQRQKMERELLLSKKREEDTAKLRDLMSRGAPSLVETDPSTDFTDEDVLGSQATPGDRQRYQAGVQDHGRQMDAAMMAAYPKLSVEAQYAQQLAKAKRGAGPYQGKGLPQQVMNTLLTGDPSTQQYASAYAHYARPKTFQDPNTGQMTTVTPDMSPYKVPTFKGAAGAYGPKTSQRQYAQPRLTEGQSKSRGFYDRLVSAQRDLELTDTEGASLKGRMAEGVPGGNYVQTPSYQRFEQARRNFINAVLRRESGAVINPSEFENADRQYFPVPGDGKEVIAQKRRNRRDALKAMKRSSTPGYKEEKAKGPSGTAPAKKHTARPGKDGKVKLKLN